MQARSPTKREREARASLLTARRVKTSRSEPSWFELRGAGFEHPAPGLGVYMRIHVTATEAAARTSIGWFNRKHSIFPSAPPRLCENARRSNKSPAVKPEVGVRKLFRKQFPCYSRRGEVCFYRVRRRHRAII